MPLPEHEMVAFNLLNKSRPNKDLGVVVLTTNEGWSLISSKFVAESITVLFAGPHKLSNLPVPVLCHQHVWPYCCLVSKSAITFGV